MARLVEVQGISVRSFPENMYMCVIMTNLALSVLGQMMGELGVNIATFHLGRKQAGGEAIALVEIDEAVSPDTLQTIRNMPQVVGADYLLFA